MDEIVEELTGMSCIDKMYIVILGTAKGLTGDDGDNDYAHVRMIGEYHGEEVARAEAVVNVGDAILIEMRPRVD